MKRTQNMFICALAMALACSTSLRAAEEGQKEGNATVRSTTGTVEYLDNAAWVPVKTRMKFAPGVTLRTGSDGVAYLSVNGVSSAICLTNNTTLSIPSMSYVGSTSEGDTTTMLKLTTGSVLGNVKKISANSRYEITTPHGVAAIRGTDFKVEVITTAEGKVTVRFDSITGIITVSAVINGEAVTHTLTTGTMWEVGESPEKIAEQVEQDYQHQILQLVQIIENGPGPGPGPGHNHGPGNGPGNGPANPNPPFPAGPPQGPPAS
jgi:hypothetical protein